MLDDHPKVQEQNWPSGKLVLPAYPGEEQPPNGYEQRTTAYSGPLPHHKASTALTSAASPLGKFSYLVRTDPAYKVLVVAVVMVLIASAVFVGLASAAFFSSQGAAQTSGLSSTPTSGPVDPRPTFAPPNGGQGSTTSSQPPANPTPSIQNTPAPASTPQPTTPPVGALTLQIFGLPPQALNNTTVPVTVIANQPGLSVKLVITYSVPPGFFTSAARTTDGNGTATLSWHVRIFSARKAATARVVAIAQDQNGNQVASQTVTVQILAVGFGA